MLHLVFRAIHFTVVVSLIKFYKGMIVLCKDSSRQVFTSKTKVNRQFCCNQIRIQHSSSIRIQAIKRNFFEQLFFKFCKNQS
jgi:hypothetical protein